MEKLVNENKLLLNCQIIEYKVIYKIEDNSEETNIININEILDTNAKLLLFI